MKLEKLQYQLDAVECAIDEIRTDNVILDNNFNANPMLNITKGIDIKMETGTGKTYVYTRLIHRLKQEFACFKFIILVPSVAIKEGAKMSIQSPDWHSHFGQEFNHQSIHLGIINAGDFDSKKGKRKQIPETIRNFCESTRNEQNTIQALLLNDAMLASKSMTADDYDTTLFGSVTSPIQGLQSTRPIVIIDEPHRFNKNNKAWKNIVEGLKPQLIIRLGATFPEKTIGTGRNKIIEKDYENLVYDLNAVRAFNEGLVKGVHIVYPAIANPNASEKFRVKQIDKTAKKVIFNQNNKELEIKVGESLAALHSGFAGITLEQVLSAQSAILSNDMQLNIGLDLLPNIFDMGYQELLLNQALDAHFEKEKQNFYRERVNNNPTPIKTNSLFFIDSVASFRDEQQQDKKGWLRLKFEELLSKKLQQEIKTATGEYQEFLQASLQNVSATIAGYFAEDNSKKGDEAIQAEVDDILRNKENMLQFKNQDESWNIRRFLFSKWALREGWDNPNVFVICKLRSSGSEISKIQEVGRGLRLPFDSKGIRQSQHTGEDFRLSYIIDFSEREFAEKLIGEINADGGKIAQGIITEQLLELLVKAKYKDADSKEIVKAYLLIDKVINAQDEIIDTEKLIEILPESSGVKLTKGKITGVDLPKLPTVKLNKSNFEKLRSLWQQVTKRYALNFEKIPETDLKSTLIEVLKADNIFEKPSVQVVDIFIQANQNSVQMIEGGYRSINSHLSVIPYGEFLKRLNKRTHLPLKLLHAAMIAARHNQATPQELFNAKTLDNIINGFDKKFIELYRQKFTYSALNYQASTSVFKRVNDELELVDELPQGDIGKFIAEDILRGKDNYLYQEKYLYDSEIEHQVLKVEPPKEVVVYGKLPRKSIKLPTYTGGTTSPDFIYAIKQDNSPIQLHLVVETKSDNMRMSDEVAVQSQQKAFEYIENIQWRLNNKVQDFERDLKDLVMTR